MPLAELPEFGVSALGMWHPPRFSGTLIFRGASVTGAQGQGSGGKEHQVRLIQRFLRPNVYEILK